jgi:hypothetical protein
MMSDIKSVLTLKRWFVTFIAIFVLSVSIQFSTAESTDGVIKAGVVNSSESCGSCHAEIYDMWKRSLHAGAVTDPIFDVAYSRAYRQTAGEAKNFCLRCHAPVAVINRDLELRNPNSLEGVTCDFCHSISKVDLDNPENPYKITLDGVKRGPLRDSESPVHAVERAAVFGQAELCAGCHEYANQDGLLIFSTYSEWRISPQAEEGKVCQDCHMPAMRGNTVVPGLGVSRDVINLHNLSGGHSSEQVRKAVSLRILNLRRTEPTVARLEVEVGNVGSGHYVPTGMPTRKVVLDVDLYVAGKRVVSDQRVYQRVLLDAEGRRIDEDYRVMLDAKKLLSDNRLHPGEIRIERFIMYHVPQEGKLSAKVRLKYSYEPILYSTQQMSIDLHSEEIP